MHSSSGCSYNGGCYFTQDKSPGDEGGAAHKGSWQTRKMCSISLGQDDISVAALRVAGKRESIQGALERTYLSLLHMIKEGDGVSYISFFIMLCLCTLKHLDNLI